MFRKWLGVGLAAVVGAFLFAFLLPSDAWAGGPNPRARQRIIDAQERHSERLMAIPGVVGTAAGGEAVMVLVENEDVKRKIPKKLDDVPVEVNVSGEILARPVDTTSRLDRPVPTGVSTGNILDCSAGTIGCRVTDGAQVFALSNNHVFALSNAAPIGSAILQPGRYDADPQCATYPADQIGTLYDFEPIKFQGNARNTMDAAIALCTIETLGNSTPEGGYGKPTSTVADAFVGQAVQKFGRTTQLTAGGVTGTNGLVRVTYQGVGTAVFKDQIIVESGPGFLLAGDSGSLLVTDPGAGPVGLLFAGNDTGTLGVANPIGPVLDRFGVTVDDSEDVDTTDIAITSVDAPSSVEQGLTVDVNVTVANVGTLPVGTDLNVTLTDTTDAVQIGTETIVGGLGVGASTTLTFSWNTAGATLGDHVLTAAHDFADDNAANDSASDTSNVFAPGGALSVEAVSPNSVQAGNAVAVEITGTGFEAGAAVSLEGGSGPTPDVSDVVVQSATSITATISTKGGGPPRPRAWDVRVTNPGGATDVLPGGFTVMP